MDSTLDHLECSLCGRTVGCDVPRGLCEPCGGVLLARYRLDEATTLQPDALHGRVASQWRYAEVLPGSASPVTLGEGLTPLRRAPRLGAALGVERLWIKDESVNPTGSFKARGMSAAVTMARDLGVRHLALPSAGNAGGAAAAYAALAGIPVEVFLPRDTPMPFRLETAAYGAGVHLVDGDITDGGREVRERAGREGWFDLSTLREPYRLEGKKTMGYEIAEQLGWELPDFLLYPTGGGTGLIGIWKAFEELETLGLLAPGRRPRMVAVQADGCAPIVRAFEAGEETATPWADPHTYASGLRVPAAVGDRLMLRVLRESDGLAIAVSDVDMAAAQLDMARTEGIFPAPEGGATIAAARRLAREGTIGARDRVLLLNTGSGLKYPEIPGLDVA